ncbi:MAG: DNA-binding response OmpR family regulator [Kiritimatiellia bacterium]|jgi:DNA-binding response OmpR family regulator
MSTRARILVIEDEAPIRQGLLDLLAFHGYQPTGVADGDAGLAQALTGEFDLLLVDVMLPGTDGFTICRNVREALPGQAICLLTARGGESDVLEGFSAGCDDYISKPFSVSQLIARVQALLRRVSVQGAPDLRAGAVVIDVRALRAECAGRAVDLSPRDVEIVDLLATARPSVVSREVLLKEIWGFRRVDAVETRCVDMHMVKLRRKLGKVVDDSIIETVRGAGYRLAEPA